MKTLYPTVLPIYFVISMTIRGFIFLCIPHIFCRYRYNALKLKPVSKFKLVLQVKRIHNVKKYSFDITFIFTDF